MSTSLDYIRSIAASAHVVSVQQVIKRLSDDIKDMQDLLDAAPIVFTLLDITNRKASIRRANGTLVALEKVLKATDEHFDSMRDWHKDLLKEALTGLEEKKTKAFQLKEELSDIVAQF